METKVSITVPYHCANPYLEEDNEKERKLALRRTISDLWQTKLLQPTTSTNREIPPTRREIAKLKST